MRLEDYAWNEHERRLKQQQQEYQYSVPKIKIVDDVELRRQVEDALEQLPQKVLAQWALEVAEVFLKNLDEDLWNDSRINLGVETLRKRINGDVGAYELRQVGFVVNELAKESKSDIGKYAARCFAQAIATGHMRGHALVSSDYAIKVINIVTDQSLPASTVERKRQLNLVHQFMV